MAKRSSSHEEEGQEPKGLVHLKKEDNDNEKGDNDYCPSCLIHTRKNKKEQDHEGSTKKQVQNHKNV
jgi:hypothetical protein